MLPGSRPGADGKCLSTLDRIFGKRLARIPRLGFASALGIGPGSTKDG
jgi:hypothetical protein